jgi:hypothetical protein
MLRMLIGACAVLALAQVVHAQDPELPRLREELKALQQRVQDLERRKTASTEAAFNPGISLILQGTAARSSRDPATYEITGFAPSGGEVGPRPRGFSLGESELIISGNIDPYFRGQVVAALTPEDELEVEEAFFQTSRLGNGFSLKGGRFLSGIGYQNEIHSHAWDFADAPLAYAAFLGGRLNDDGIQARWVAPTDLFVELGAEAGRGRSFPSSERDRNGANLWTLFGHVGGDVGQTAWRAGLSFLRAAPRERGFEDIDSLGNPAIAAFSGRSRMWIADAVIKWQRFKLQSELFQRRERGELASDVLSGDYASRQRGGYAQAVYEFMPRWRAGYRYDRLDHGTVSGASGIDSPLLMTPHDPTRHSVMVDWSPTEFSRLRVQLASDRSRAGVTDQQALIQYIFSLGAHGAHRF